MLPFVPSFATSPLSKLPRLSNNSMVILWLVNLSTLPTTSFLRLERSNRLRLEIALISST